jgi:ribose transport system ATP-binding protein
MPRTLLQAESICKSFPGVRALRDVSLDVMPGEVVAVIGENGAGKSTLMKILAGIQQPDAGRLLVDGIPSRIESVRQAETRGIALIHQELNLADNLDVAGNIFLGREPHLLGILRRRQMDRMAQPVLDQVGLNVSPRALLADLPLGKRQMVEIAKAVSVNARVLIMDEPTSSLSATETRALFHVVHQLRSRGVAIIYISHRLGEVKELADRVVVLRDGQHVGQLTRDEIDHQRMVQMMVGRDVSKFYARQRHKLGDTVLRVCDLATPANPEHLLNFRVAAGEVVGLAGLVGAGRTELLRVLFGIERAICGSVQVHGRPVPLRRSPDAVRAGFALVPEDRKAEGLALPMTVRQNMSMAGLHRHQLPGGILNLAHERQLVAEMISKLSIRTPHASQVVRHLSGGNQQKVVLAKWLSMKPLILLLDEPTRGVDVGAKQEIYSLMERLAQEGVAILFASSEMEEILGMSDRVLVMREGRITGEVPRDELTEEAVMHLATLAE